MRRVGALVLATALVASLAACGASADHVRLICSDVTTRTALLDRYDPAEPLTALQFALGRFDLVEDAVSTARETGLPDDAAAGLRTDWLEPAVRSMASWDTRLQAVRTAVESGDASQVDSTLAAALALGTEGVDRAALQRLGYDTCATAFTAPTVASTRS